MSVALLGLGKKFFRERANLYTKFAWLKGQFGHTACITFQALDDLASFGSLATSSVITSTTN